MEQEEQNVEEDLIPLYSPRTTFHHIKQTEEHLLADLALNFDPFTIK
jgi:hypothetical protein